MHSKVRANIELTAQVVIALAVVVAASAILPNSADEARKYLQYLELPIENIQTGPLSSYKISGTPTVLFVDSQGIVRSVWFGAQTEREKDMRDKLVELFDEKTSN
jgi:hypothetical protein